jgi:hypothetical protein
MTLMAAQQAQTMQNTVMPWPLRQDLFVTDSRLIKCAALMELNGLLKLNPDFVIGSSKH